MPKRKHAWIVVVAILMTSGAALATEPCGDLEECKALIEINASDGDIGFHFLIDSAGLTETRMGDPDLNTVFRNRALNALAEQTLTENFVESSEPLCWPDPDADPDEEIVTLDEFLARWTPGIYRVQGRDSEGEVGSGQTVLSYALPAAPVGVDFDGSAISWSNGDDLGNCATFAELTDLVTAGTLPIHPVDVDVEIWEVVLEPDTDVDAKLTIRVPGDVAVTALTVPADYLASLPNDTPAKIEVGAITDTDNATFAEEGGFCLNEVNGCPDD